MLSHEPKNYALLALRRHADAARRRVPLEPRRAVRRSVPAPRDRAACSPATSPACATPTSTTLDALRRRALPTHDVSSRVRLTKTPERVSRDARDAAASCRTRRCSRAAARRGAPASACASIARGPARRRRRRARRRRATRRDADPRDYDVEHYVRAAARHVRRAARARVHPRRLRRRVRRSRSAVALPVRARRGATRADDDERCQRRELAITLGRQPPPSAEGRRGEREERGADSPACRRTAVRLGPPNVGPVTSSRPRRHTGSTGRPRA